MSLALENPVIRHIVVLTVFTLFIFLLPAFGLLTLSLLTLRRLLTLYKNAFKPDYGDFLSGMNNFFAAEDPYTGRPSATVVGYGFFEGNLTLQEMRDLIEGKLEEFENHSEPWFPELKQYLTTWMGFCILKREGNFQLKEHAKLLSDLDPKYRDLEVNEDNVGNVCVELSRIPFKKGRSCWEFLVHHNVKYQGHGQRSIILVRFHHTLGDALALMKLLGHFFNKPKFFETFFKKFERSIEKKEQSLAGKMWYGSSFPFLGAYEVASRIADSWDDNFWHPAPVVRPRICRDFYYLNLAAIDKERIQKLREKFGGVKFFTVILAAFTSGMKNFMVKQKVPVPRNFHTVISVPLPKKDNRLSNNLTNTIVEIPIGLQDRREIVMAIEKDTRNGKASRYPVAMLMIAMFLGILPRKLIFNYWIFTTMATTNFPGFDEPGFFAGHQLLYVTAVGNIPNSTTGIYLWSSGYTDKLFLTLALSKHIASSMDQMKQLRSFVMEELEALEENKKID